MNSLGELQKLLKEKPDGYSFDEWFKKIATVLMNNLVLCIQSNRYRIVECEFYYNDEEGEENHLDPYTHCGDEQKTMGALYYNNAGGLDLTFGNEKVYAGILIRKLVNLNKNESQNKLYKIVREIFGGMGNVLEGDVTIKLSNSEPPFDSSIESCKRLGLRTRECETEFLKKEYRFVAS